MDDFDRTVVASLIGFVVLCVVGYALLANQIVTTCKKTTDVRTTTTYVMSGKMLLPVVSTQYRYACPDGSDAWL